MRKRNTRIALGFVKGIFDHGIVDTLDEYLPVDPISRIDINVNCMAQNRVRWSGNNLKEMPPDKTAQVLHRLEFKFDPPAWNVLCDPVTYLGMAAS